MALTPFLMFAGQAEDAIHLYLPVFPREDGRVHMPPAEYPFARRFTWMSDRNGVSWQLWVAPR
jgi:predicted 3-demethylubiquinone-9 3-methyltransferase (glyoxalase superfamily)